MITTQTVILPSDDIASRPLWPELHRTINESYLHKKTSAFPPSWTRLDRDPNIGAQTFTRELGRDGAVAVILLEQVPIACGGVFPYPRRDFVWGSDLETIGMPSGKFRLDADATTTFCNAQQVGSSIASSTEEWEICCFCVHPDYRHQGFGDKLLGALIEHICPLGAKRLFLNYVVEETGIYWPNMGFERVAGLGSVLKKGWTHTDGVEGLQTDIHLAWGVRDISTSLSSMFDI